MDVSGESASTLTDDIDALFQLSGSEQVSAFEKLVASHGKPAVEGWKDMRNKHRHRLIHIAVAKGAVRLVGAMVNDHGFDINLPRDSDQCTPMHLAMFYKKPHVIRKLHYLGADLTLKNSYGEDCGDKYQKFVDSYENIIWLDLELTRGFYDSRDEPPQILEAGVVITDKNLNELGRGQWIVGGYGEDFLNSLPDFHQKHFRDNADGGRFPPLPDYPGNGLFSEVLGQGKPLAQVEVEIIKLLKEHCPDNGCPIAGNSVQCDREVLLSQMPKLHALLNHQIIDISSFIGMAKRWMPEKVEEWKEDQKSCANYNHRTINDCEASIQSMRWIRKNLLVQPVAD
eukprot:gnl/TRDRNA2_/TRDRNA2_49274_c0_seq1.p1 gnl/TRDRNA2_/TRDRNA2_49274_c0~~gnl/TRDRNA2_/TRDRNA2_49274_c0_seq1.p1  ORF type:complete len:341 (-),score=60.90 gnl/TRDRNA2_/TRDRNA2_49274_c0_seq1:30-1052(-)